MPTDEHPLETQPPKEGRWIARPQKARWLPILGGSIAFVAQLPNLLRMVLKPWMGEVKSWVFIVVLVAAFGMFAAYFALRERRARRIRVEDLAMMDGNFGDQFPAEMTVVVDGQRLGTDRGVVWFADGLLGFSGGAAAFVLAAYDVERQGTPDAKLPLRLRMPRNALKLVGAPAYAYVTINPLGDHRAAFLDRLTRFEKETASPDAERFWPPLVPYDTPSNALQSELSPKGLVP